MNFLRSLSTPLDDVKLTNELVRVCAIPRRVVTDEEADYLVELMTGLLRKPGGTQRLRRVQAVALYEVGQLGGVAGPITVGGGKTLISLLAPVVAESERPLLVLPAKFVDKTLREWRAYAEHWDIPEFIQIRSCEWLGRVQAAEFLERFLPDLIVVDEVHKFKNTGAACTRRMRRFMAAHPETKHVDMSGTFTNRSLHEYAHILKWSLSPENYPLPDNYNDLVMWSGALDEEKDNENPCRPGMLKALCVNADGTRNEEEIALWDKDEITAARRAFRRRLIETPGVVAAFSDELDATLAVEAVEPAFAKKIATHLTPDDKTVIDSVEAAFRYLRGKWKTPDGWTISDGLTMFRHARELAVGFFYRWRPRPPKEWLEPRKAWHRFVRETLKHSRKLDSELAVARAFPNCDELVAWRNVRDTFTPNVEAVWLDESVVHYAADWMEREKGICWVEHKCVGEKLQEFGFDYYGAQGRNAAGRLIDDHPRGQPLVASIKSSGEGRNLQAWNRNLVLGFPSNGRGAEQLIGRTHRPGQDQDEVTMDVLATCYEHVSGFWQAVADAEYARDSTGAPQKILLASVNVPSVSEIFGRSGKRWSK